MDLFNSSISDCLYGESSTKDSALNKPKEKESLKSFFNRENISIEKYESLKEMYEGCTIPDRFLGVEEGLIPSPVCNRTYKSEFGGKVEVWGNSAKIDSNLKVYREDGLWYRDRKEYDSVNDIISKKRSRNYTPTRTKGDIKGMSKNARRRLIKKVNKVDYKNRQMPYWITLTYPKRFPTESKEYKADLDAFFKRLKRAFGSIEYIWRLEFQKRGAPHYHLILFLPEWNGNLTYLRKWISKNWFEVVQRFWDDKDEKHLRAGTNCKRIKAYRQLISYVSKYMGKTDGTEIEETGRVWGASNNWGDFIGSVVIDGRELVQFVRIIRRYVKSQGSKKMAKYMAKNPNTEVFLPWSVVVQALEWVESSQAQNLN